MSTLYYTELGFVIPTMGEELSIRRRARKILELPPTDRDASIFVLADSHPTNNHPLRMTVNGAEVEAIRPEAAGYRWYEKSLPVDRLRPGSNMFEFWVDTEGMDGWSLGVEYGGRATASEVSMDRGSTWSAERIGHLNVGPGEYLVRVRLQDGRDPKPPAFIAATASDDGAEALRLRLPPEVVASGDTVARVRRLATWTSTAWRYRNDHDAAQYTPWDPMTCLAWGAAGRGHDGQTPIVMCVHYAVVFVAACAAVGIPARPAVFVDDVNSPNGHFVAEVWLETEHRWVLVDPNVDAMFYNGDRAMSVDEIRAERDLTPHVRWGPGHTYQARRPSMRRWIRDVLLPGVCFRHRGVWPRSDFVTNPGLTPPAHGCTAYSELDIVWEKSDLGDGFAMFRYFAEPGWFSAPPVVRSE